MLVNVGGQGGTTADIRVVAVMSMPRLSFTANHLAWLKALMPLGIEPQIYTGAFWDQCLSRGFASAIKGAEYILSLDYDSFILREDIEQLFTMAMAFQCDALAPMQTKREDGRPMITPLGTFDGPDRGKEIELNGEWLGQPVQEVDAAHFGCTIISCAALKRMRKPWLHSKPNDNGDWEDGRIDPDMWFWQQWRRSGNRVYMTPRVVIGHGEYHITWPGADLKTPVYQHCTDFTTHCRKPDNVWRVKA